MSEAQAWGDKVKMTTVATSYHRYSIGLLSDRLKEALDWHAMEVLAPPHSRSRGWRPRVRDWLASKLLAVAYRVASPRWTAE